ncbi:MAG: HAMP domain-containing protein [Gammaproteobacteria bacterium]|nr:HAMP domain-containing protein [Gammaproteobacteria bacterium]MCB1872710.1 HAMP domain-containing protein [Gammaproteobacteria bacterium]MCB1879850.1 HAMP domain-containing protein [Gammaproteobacteria bacterium]
MGKIARVLRIGEKIGFGFGLVGAIFLVVIWQYHNTLQQSLGDYRSLQNIHVAKKVDMLKIESSMREARRAEKDFLLQRTEDFARDADTHLHDALLITAELGRIDPESAPVAEQITGLIEVYREKFQATVDAWEKKGLDHNSGLQGAFREAAHELEAMAGNFDVDSLYLQLLQIRRGEKDLGLRREQQYRAHVLSLLLEFENKTAASKLDASVKTLLLQEIETYRHSFENYASSALSNADIQGGKGPFRQTAHRIEALLNNHRIPDMANNILQLRRREKDYLLRGDKIYVDMALKELNLIHNLVEPAAISSTQKSHLLSLLENYRRDFLALVDQNNLIISMTGEMNRAVTEIADLVESNVKLANQVAQQMVTEIEASSAEKERLMLWLVALATLLGVLFAVSITLRIVRPLRSMAGILDRLAYEEPSERLPFYTDGRDEVNLMAGSVNTMADNKARLINWWKSTMREAAACENLEMTLNKTRDDPARAEAETEFRQALSARHELLLQQFQKLHDLNGNIIKHAESLRREVHVGQTQSSINTISYSARSLQSILELIGFQEHAKKPAA